MTPRILIVTPLLRSYGRAITAAHRLVRRAPCPVEWLTITEQPYAGYDYRNVLYANERARTAMLAGDYTHLLMLEDDIVPPPDALAKLLSCEADVAYGLYCWRRALHEWSAYARIGESIGTPWPHHDRDYAVAAFTAGDVIPSQGVGFGCTLIRRELLETITFRLPTDFAEGGACTDWMFALDCQALGAHQVSHLGVACGHISMEPSARVIWPDFGGRGQPWHRYELFEVEA
jgi:hypothetical protein